MQTVLWVLPSGVKNCDGLLLRRNWRSEASSTEENLGWILASRNQLGPSVEKIPWRRKWQPAPVFLPGKFHAQQPRCTLLRICIHKVVSEVAQLCPTLCNLLDCSLPGSSIHGIFWAGVLEWVAIPFSRGSSWPRDQTLVSCIAGRCFTVWATRESHKVEQGEKVGMLSPRYEWGLIPSKMALDRDASLGHSDV